MNAFATPQRRRLPNRRPAETFDLDAEGRRLTATVGFSREGLPSEIFLSGAKSGADLDAILADASVAISIALQYAVPPRKLAKSIAKIPETIEGPATRPASVIGTALDLLAGGGET